MPARRRPPAPTTSPLTITPENPFERPRRIFRLSVLATATAATVTTGALTTWTPYLLLPPTTAAVLEPALWFAAFRTARALSRPLKELHTDAEAAEQIRKLYARGLDVHVGDRRPAPLPLAKPYGIRFQDIRSRTSWVLHWDGKRLHVTDRLGMTRVYRTAVGGVHTGRLPQLPTIGLHPPAVVQNGVPTVVEIAMVRDAADETIEYVHLLDIHSRRLVGARVPSRIARRALGRVARRAGVDFVRYRLHLPRGMRFESAAEALFPGAVGHGRQALDEPRAVTFRIEE